MTKSIFELERRFDFEKEYLRLLEYLNDEDFHTSSYLSGSFWDVVNEFFPKWDYRLSALNFEQYFEDIGIDVSSLEECDDVNKLYVIQFVDNFINFISYENLINIKYIQPYLCVFQNIGYILERLNYKRNVDKIISYIKRDEDVDSVLKQFECDTDLRMLLLNYNDFRIEKDVNAKMMILKALGDYLEPLRTNLKSYDRQLTDDIFFILNSGKIRHPNKPPQIEYTSVEETIEWYDKLFKMIIHLLRSVDIAEIKKEITELKTRL